MVSANKLITVAGLQAHLFSAQWTTLVQHWGVEVRLNQNRGARDLIFCSINTFVCGSVAMCCGAAVAAIFM